MGTWGTGLYQNDIGEDVRDYYKDQLHRGKKGAEITKELIEIYADSIQDQDDASQFWLALADTQWNMGRLQEDVKANALCCLEDPCTSMRWREENPAAYSKYLSVQKSLREKLATPQPPEKKVSQYHLYHCNWAIGDVYAYPLSSPLAEQLGLSEGWVLMEKISEKTWHPGHIVPIVYLKICAGSQLPTDEADYNRIPYQQTGFVKYENRFLPIDGRRPAEDIAEKSKREYITDEAGLLPIFRVTLVSTSKRVIPSNLQYLGKLGNAVAPVSEYVPYSDLSVPSSLWKNFEKFALTAYQLFTLKTYGIYHNAY